MLCHAAWHWTGLLACHPLGAPGVVGPPGEAIAFKVGLFIISPSTKLLAEWGVSQTHCRYNLRLFWRDFVLV
jgi:hypothetical protein